MHARLAALAAVLATAALPATALAATPKAGTYRGKLGKKVLTVKVKDGKGTASLKCTSSTTAVKLGTRAITDGKVRFKKTKNGVFTVYVVKVRWTSATKAKASFDGLICDGMSASGTITRQT